MTGYRFLHNVDSDETNSCRPVIGVSVQGSRNQELKSQRLSATSNREAAGHQTSPPKPRPNSTTSIPGQVPVSHTVAVPTTSQVYFSPPFFLSLVWVCAAREAHVQTT